VEFDAFALTKLCTYRNHLALGLITSPILANQILYSVDARIGKACIAAGLVYTRFVDDIAISGAFDLQNSGFADLVGQILLQNGFNLNPSKHRFGRISSDFSITGVRIIRGHLDVRKEFMKEVERQLEDVTRLARGEEFTGPYYTRAQIYGRVHFASWVNPGRRRQLMPRLRAIRWSLAEAEARDRGLVVSKKILRRIN